MYFKCSNGQVDLRAHVGMFQLMPFLPDSMHFQSSLADTSSRVEEAGGKRLAGRSSQVALSQLDVGISQSVSTYFWFKHQIDSSLPSLAPTWFKQQRQQYLPPAATGPHYMYLHACTINQTILTLPPPD